MLIYHILHKDALAKIESIGYHEPESLRKEGFIHCSTEEQVLATANRRYFDQKDLILLVIETEKIEAKIITEDTSGREEKHPHIYGKLPWSAVVDVRKLQPEANGSFVNFPSK